MRAITLIAGIFMIIKGVLSIHSSFKNIKSGFWEMPSTTYIPRKIFGKHFNKYHNLFWGIIFLVIGFVIISIYITQNLKL